MITFFSVASVNAISFEEAFIGMIVMNLVLNIVSFMGTNLHHYSMYIAAWSVSRTLDIKCEQWYTSFHVPIDVAFSFLSMYQGFLPPHVCCLFCVCVTRLRTSRSSAFLFVPGEHYRRSISYCIQYLSSFLKKKQAKQSQQLSNKKN